MLALITPRPHLNPVVPLVANGSLVAEIEKLHVKLDAVSVDIARVSNIMQVVGEAEPLAPVPAVVVPAPVDNLAQILDEMLIQHTDCATVFPSKWDAITTCARIFFTKEEY